MLETDIVPAYFDRDTAGLPTRWIPLMRHALREALTRFTARTMLRTYTDDRYLPAMRGLGSGDDPPA